MDARVSHDNTIVGPTPLEIIFRAKTGFVSQHAVAVTAGIYISQNMNLSDEDIQRIVDRLRPTLPQILQNSEVSDQATNRSERSSNNLPSSAGGPWRSSSDQTPAVREAAALSQLFRRPSYVNRHRYSTPYQRQTQNIPNRRRRGLQLLQQWQQTTDQMLFWRRWFFYRIPQMIRSLEEGEKLTLEERGLVITGHSIVRTLSEQELLSSFEKLFEHVLIEVTSTPK